MPNERRDMAQEQAMLDYMQRLNQWRHQRDTDLGWRDQGSFAIGPGGLEPLRAPRPGRPLTPFQEMEMWRYQGGHQRPPVQPAPEPYPENRLYDPYRGVPLPREVAPPMRMGPQLPRGRPL